MLCAVNTSDGFISTRTEKQAMDWSLVLISQGIAAVIERDAETVGWGLRVNESDYSRAVQTLRQYVAENRRRRWQQELPWSGLILDYRCAIWILFLIFLFGQWVTRDPGLNDLAMMNNEAVWQGEWWRVFTAVTVHADLVHIALNATIGFVLIGLAMGAFGPGLGLLLPYVAGVAANVVGLLFYGTRHYGLGASGMVMGALGLLAAQWLGLLRHGLAPKDLAARGLLSGCLLLVLLGFSPSPNVDYVAHVAGFFAGLALGALFALAPNTPRQRACLNGLALALFLVLVAMPWWQALRQAG